MRIATASENYDGDSPDNIVNRLTAGGTHGVQIEQSIEAREGFWKAIAHAVADVYAEEMSWRCYEGNSARYAAALSGRPQAT